MLIFVVINHMINVYWRGKKINNTLLVSEFPLLLRPPFPLEAVGDFTASSDSSPS